MVSRLAYNFCLAFYGSCYDSSKGISKRASSWKSSTFRWEECSQKLIKYVTVNTAGFPLWFLFFSHFPSFCECEKCKMFSLWFLFFSQYTSLWTTRKIFHTTLVWTALITLLFSPSLNPKKLFGFKELSFFIFFHKKCSANLSITIVLSSAFLWYSTKPFQLEAKLPRPHHMPSLRFSRTSWCTSIASELESMQSTEISPVLKNLNGIPASSIIRAKKPRKAYNRKR